MAKLRKVHEYQVDRQAGNARLVRVNPIRDYGRNPEWDGKKLEEKTGDTERVIVQRLHGSDEHYFFTGDGTPLDPKDVPAYIKEDLKRNPLVGEVGGSVDTICICKACGDPIPQSLYAEHLERHLDRGASSPADDEDEPEPAATSKPHGRRAART